MKRIRLSLGDVFAVKIENGRIRCFQYIGNDLSQLNSAVVRIFKRSFSDDISDLAIVVNDEVEFYAHTIVNMGVKMELWKKIGNVKELGKIDIRFRCSNDYGIKIGEEPVVISDNWYVWKMNEECQQVGKLKGDNQNSDLGLVVPPDEIVYRIKNGNYSFFHPKF